MQKQTIDDKFRDLYSGKNKKLLKRIGEQLKASKAIEDYKIVGSGFIFSKVYTLQISNPIMPIMPIKKLETYVLNTYVNSGKK